LASRVFSTILIPWNGNLYWLFSLRMVQGLSGGLTIPLLMTTALRVLAPPVRLYGLACNALTATFFPNISATVAALWTDYWIGILFSCNPFLSLP
jgi:DHA2 family multidrug resistance protein